MVFETVNTKYRVISCEQQEEEMQVFLCRTERNEEYRVFRVCEADDFAGILRYFTSLEKNRKFRDFRECFVQDGCFFLVMAHSRGTRLSQKLERETMLLSERLQMGAELLKRLIFLDMPYYIMYEAMDSSYITYTDSMEVGFLYHFHSLSECVCERKQDAFRRIAGIFSELFSKELEKEVIPPMRSLLQKMEKDSFENITQLYRDYLETAELIRNIPEEELGKPKNKYFLLWEKLRKRAKQLKNAALFLLFVLVLVYVCHSIYGYVAPKGEEKIFEYIGTVDFADRAE